MAAATDHAAMAKGTSTASQATRSDISGEKGRLDHDAAIDKVGNPVAIGNE